MQAQGDTPLVSLLVILLHTPAVSRMVSPQSRTYASSDAVKQLWFATKVLTSGKLKNEVTHQVIMQRFAARKAAADGVINTYLRFFLRSLFMA